jgi:hypothetical protein
MMLLMILFRQNTSQYVLLAHTIVLFHCFLISISLAQAQNPISQSHISQGDLEIKQLLIKGQSQALSEALSERKPWRDRAMAWFSANQAETQRQEMRALSKSIQYGCFDCHTKGFKGYLENRLISQQMMAISVENGVGCEHCHIGALGLNEAGVKSKKMWQWSIELQRDCLFCHEEKQGFKKLNGEGEKYKGDWEKRELKSSK